MIINYFNFNFCDCIRFINSKNRANLGYVLAVNHLADYYDEELKLLGGCKNVKRKQHARKTFHYINSSFNDLPDNVDWRTVDAVTPVQGMYMLSFLYIIFVDYFLLFNNVYNQL